MKHYFIFNIAAANGKRKNLFKKFKLWIKENLPESIIHETEAPQHATELAKQATKEKCDICIVAGGDGTLHEALNGLMQIPEEKRPALGMLPFGTGCDFIRHFIKPQSLLNHWEWLKAPKLQKIDVGYLKITNQHNKESYFINSLDIGLPGEITRRVNLSNKKWGSWSYLMNVLLSFINFKHPQIDFYKLEPKQKKKLKSAILLSLSFANGKYLGGGMSLAPNAKLDDGVFDWAFIEKVSIIDLFSQISKLLGSKLLHHPKVTYGKGESFLIRSVKKILPINVDGEFYQGKQIQVSILPQAIQIALP